MEAFKLNMSGNDRVIRILLGAIGILLLLAGIVYGTFGWVTLVISIIFILTGFIGFCPLYALFGIKSSRSKE